MMLSKRPKTEKGPIEVVFPSLVCAFHCCDGASTTFSLERSKRKGDRASLRAQAAKKGTGKDALTATTTSSRKAWNLSTSSPPFSFIASA